MDFGLSGKRALVGGASQGLGAACAWQLAALGAEVIVLARNEQKLLGVVSQLPATEGQKHSYCCADSADLPHLTAQVQAQLDKGGAISIWVNNTGGPAPGPAHLATPQEFTHAFSQHLPGSQAVLQLLLPGMRELGYGRIINVLSTSVKTPLANLGVSNSIRAAMANWAKTLSRELAADGITVNNVLPGLTRTARLEGLLKYRADVENTSVAEVERGMLRDLPARRFAEPKEFANAVEFLASPAASYINGINLPVDGGATASL
ncbi:MAG: SDR family oxidoreductase [Pseudomonas sp.]